MHVSSDPDATRRASGSFLAEEAEIALISLPWLPSWSSDVVYFCNIELYGDAKHNYQLSDQAQQKKNENKRKHTAVDFV